jgi:hypothetical protein
MRKPLHHSTVAGSLIACILATAGVLAAVAYGQGSAAPRPDLQGIWTSSTLTPLERPAGMEGKPVLTGPEAVQLAKFILQQQDRDRRDGGEGADVVRGYNELFFDRGNALARIGGTIPTSLIFDPPNGQIPPLTAAAVARVAAQRAETSEHPADSPRNRSLPERCLLAASTGPPMVPGLYNNYYQIVQTPDYVMILSEMMHDVRIVPLDALNPALKPRPHPPPAVRLWLGDSVGHWDGQTLVVDTTNFTAKTSFHGSDANLHLIERFTRVAPAMIVYEFTVDDPTAFTRSWSARLPLVSSDGPIYEYACHEGNYALRDILAGAREEERKAEPPARPR